MGMMSCFLEYSAPGKLLKLMMFGLCWVQWIPTAISAGKAIMDTMNKDDAEAPTGLNLRSPYYSQAQDKLYGEGVGILEGRIPELLQPSLQTGHPESLKMLNQITGDISKNVMESRARSGRVADPSTAEIIGKQTARASTEFNWKDLMRSLDAQQRAYDTGTGLVAGVGEINLQSSQFQDKLGFEQQKYQAGQESIREAQDAQAWGDIIGLAGTAAGTYFGKSNTNTTPTIGSAETDIGGGYEDLDLFEGQTYVS